MISLVLFDVDGVLLDSSTPHLQICRDKSREYRLDLSIPSEAEFRTMVKQGVVISPMVCLFKAVGFPDALAEKATDEYQQIFMRDYAPQPFADLETRLQRLNVITSPGGRCFWIGCWRTADSPFAIWRNIRSFRSSPFSRWPRH